MKKTTILAIISIVLIFAACGKQNAYNNLPETIREFVIAHNNDIDKDFDEEGVRFDGIIVEGHNLIFLTTVNEGPSGYNMPLLEIIDPVRIEEAKQEGLYDIIDEIGEEEASKLFAECQEYKYDLVYRYIGSISQEKYECYYLHCDLNIEDYTGIEYQVYLKEKEAPYELRQTSLKNSLIERFTLLYSLINYVDYYSSNIEWRDYMPSYYGMLLKYNAAPSDLSSFISIYDFSVVKESLKFTTYAVIYEVDTKGMWDNVDFVEYIKSRINANAYETRELTEEDAVYYGSEANNFVRTHRGNNMYIYANVTINSDDGKWSWKGYEQSENPNKFYE